MIRRMAVLGLASLACAGCQAMRIPRDLVDLSRETRTGGEFVMEVDAEGNVINADAQIDPARLPAAVRDAADREMPGMAISSAEREFAGGHHYWEVEKKKDGLATQLLMDDEGKVVGREEELAQSKWPMHVVKAANAAVPEGRMTTVELVSGPEALGGTEYHVKKDVGGEVLRISVLEDGHVTRVVRKIKSEFKPPR